VRLEGLGKLKNSTSYGTRTGDLKACNIVPEELGYSVPPVSYISGHNAM
jgi:hypothetical protein